MFEILGVRDVTLIYKGKGVVIESLRTAALLYTISQPIKEDNLESITLHCLNIELNKAVYNGGSQTDGIRGNLRDTQAVVTRYDLLFSSIEKKYIKRKCKKVVATAKSYIEFILPQTLNFLKTTAGNFMSANPSTMTLVQKLLFMIVISSILLVLFCSTEAAPPPADYAYEVEVDPQIACSLLKTYVRRDKFSVREDYVYLKHCT
ncbi:uncharacterized protein TNCV_2397691 [Trichonephila clavipes]|uniref:Uncharacterized protein n=1 Tax=Trichonephila clavipes TaxID=2585209 RepID=A0A8X6T4N4_TRICX|nr:uncharacterized protein TNCV_2397691 [Trichonephila clavipes]